VFDGVCLLGFHACDKEVFHKRQVSFSKAISLKKRVNMIEGCRRVNLLNVCVLSFQSVKITA
jgi:hypothetical protein